ncbi:TPA: class I SAM-dependent methyltransferase [Candidatus Woesearchaeota archaeon]|nr:class I SAM-dependent methyltransferase [Candidatus Woesearchaeota archaeon]
MKKLHIGCGKTILPGYVNLDMQLLPGVDVVQDLEKFPYPFKDGEFDLIEAHQVLEHIHDLQGVMKELARILKKGGVLKIDVPHFTSNTAWMDPTHVRYFAYTTFDFFVRGHFHDEGYVYSTEYFSAIKKYLRFYKGWYLHYYLLEPIINKLIKVGNGHLYEGNFLRSFFPAWRVDVKLIK